MEAKGTGAFICDNLGRGTCAWDLDYPHSFHKSHVHFCKPAPALMHNLWLLTREDNTSIKLTDQSTLDGTPMRTTTQTKLGIVARKLRLGCSWGRWAFISLSAIHNVAWRVSLSNVQRLRIVFYLTTEVKVSYSYFLLEKYRSKGCDKEVVMS